MLTSLSTLTCMVDVFEVELKHENTTLTFKTPSLHYETMLFEISQKMLLERLSSQCYSPVHH